MATSSAVEGWTAPVGRSALVVAHPGHELRVHGWLEHARPVVFVLTDGSGGASHPRVASTRRVLAATGATVGPIFGRIPDRRLYRAIIDGSVPFFTRLADEIAGALVALQIAAVVSDAREGYNSGHDICRALVDAAVVMAGAARGREVASFDFLLVGNPEGCPEPGSVRLVLDDGALERKIQAARAYPEMASEVDAALGKFGARAFGVECLRPARPEPPVPEDDDTLPFYERYGEQQVAAGVYTDVIRAREHVNPVIGALHRHALERSGCSRSSSS